MVARSAKQMQSNGYTILVEENYYDTEEECTYPKIYLILPSIKDFNELNDIEQMMEKIYEGSGIRENEEFYYYHLEKIEKLVEECEVMEVTGNHVEAFGLKFHRIASFNGVVNLMCQNYYNYEYYVSERMKNKFVETSKLIKEKIQHILI